MLPIRRLLVLFVPFVVVLVVVPSVSAGIWSPVDSGLGAGASDIISSIDYVSPTQGVYATKSGKLGANVGGSGYVVRKTVAGVVFTGVAHQPGTNVVIAVGSNGNIWRSTDAGASWTQSTFTTFGSATPGPGLQPTYDCNDDINAANLPTRLNPPYALNAVVWGPGNRVLVTGEKGLVLQSLTAGASGSWSEINRSQIVEPGYPAWRQVSCQQAGNVSTAVSTADPSQTFFMFDDWVYFTANNLASAPQRQSNVGCSGNQRSLVVDPVNPSRQWSVTSRGSDSPCLYRTEDAQSYEGVDVVNLGSATQHETEQIAGAGSGPTLVVAGKGGDILNSIDGQHFYVQRADGALAQNDWYATSGYDANDFAVAGAGGKIVVSSAASTIPDLIAPTGSIAGPDVVTAGQPATFTAVLADEAGGSGINAAATSWAADGLPGASGPSVTWTYPAAGGYTITLTFRDNAGNVATATKYVSVQSAPFLPPVSTPIVTPVTPPTVVKTTSGSVPGGTVSLGSPSACVPKNGSFTARLSLKRRNAKGVIVTKIAKASFFVDGRKKKTDTKPPFTQTLTVKKLKAGSTYKLKATAYIRMSNKKTRTKSISTTFSVCR